MSKILKAAAAVAATIAATAGTATATAPHAAAIEFYSKLELRHSGQVLDVRNASTAGNAHVSQFPFHDGTNQQWRQEFVSAPSSNQVTGDYLLVNRNSQKCLDVENQSLKPGAHLVQTTCDFTGGKSSQRWFMHKQADVGLLDGKGYRWIFNRNSGR